MIGTPAAEKEGTKQASSQADLVDAAMTAQILLQIEQIELDCSNADWELTQDALKRLGVFQQRLNPQIAERVFELLNHLTALVRADMPSSVVVSICSRTMDFFIGEATDENIEQQTRLGITGTHIAFGIIYDALIYLADFEAAKWGLTLLKFFYAKRFIGDNLALPKEVLLRYRELEDTLRRPERKDLGPAQELVAIFKKDLENNDLKFPYLPPHLQTKGRGKS